MSAAQCSVQIKLGAAQNNLFAMPKVEGEDLLQIKQARLVIYNCHHVRAEIHLHSGMFMQLIQDNLSYLISFQFNNQTYAISVGFIPQIRNPRDSLSAYQAGDILLQFGFV